MTYLRRTTKIRVFILHCLLLHRNRQGSATGMPCMPIGSRKEIGPKPGFHIPLNFTSLTLSIALSGFHLASGEILQKVSRGQLQDGISQMNFALAVISVLAEHATSSYRSLLQPHSCEPLQISPSTTDIPLVSRQIPGWLSHWIRYVRHTHHRIFSSILSICERSKYRQSAHILNALESYVGDATVRKYSLWRVKVEAAVRSRCA